MQGPFVTSMWILGRGKTLGALVFVRELVQLFCLGKLASCTSASFRNMTGPMMGHLTSGPCVHISVEAHPAKPLAVS